MSAFDSNRSSAKEITAPNTWTLDQQTHDARSGLDQSGAPCTGSLFPTTERHARLCVVRDGLDVEVPHGWLQGLCLSHTRFGDACVAADDQHRQEFGEC